MKKLALIPLLLLLMFTSLSSLEASSSIPYYCEDDFIGPTPYDCSVYDEVDYVNIDFNTINYDRIYKTDDVWYGIIDVTNTDLRDRNCVQGRCTASEIFIKFNRETEHLKSVTYDFTTKDTCNSFSIFGICLGSKEPGYTGSHTAYDKSVNGRFIDFIFGTAEIQNVLGSTWDYKIQTPVEHGPVEKVNLVRFTYVLTNAEVDSVMADIQAQYDQEVTFIENHPSLSTNQKQQRLNQLNQEYADYQITYQEEITSDCVGDHCDIDTSTPDTEITVPGLFDDFISWFKDLEGNILRNIVLIIIGAIVAIASIYLLIMNLIKSFFKGLIKLIYGLVNFILKSLINGALSILSLLYKGLTFWI